MSKYRVLWIDDKHKEMSLLIECWKLDPSIDIELVGYELAVDGITAFEASPDSWDAVILDVQQLDQSYYEGTSIAGLTRCRDYFLNHPKQIPFFIFTGEAKWKSNKDFEILMGRRVYKKGNDQDEKDLIRDIHNAIESNPEKQLRDKYAKAIAFCPKYANHIIEIASYITQAETRKTDAFNKMRDILEWIVKYGREHGLFTQDIVKPNDAKKFIEKINAPDIVPSYIAKIFLAFNEIVQNGSHDNDAGKGLLVKEHVNKGIAPHLIESTFNLLIVLFDWLETLPTTDEEIQKLRTYTESFNKPIKGVIKQDAEGNFFCIDTKSDRMCLINRNYVISNNLQDNLVQIIDITSNTLYPANSQYPFYALKVQKDCTKI